LGAGGKDGLVKVLELLEEEITVDMALMGVTRIDQITSKYVCKAAPVTLAHEMSAFAHITGSGQLR
jgi:glycolate oxidase